MSLRDWSCDGDNGEEELYEATDCSNNAESGVDEGDGPSNEGIGQENEQAGEDFNHS